MQAVVVGEVRASWSIRRTDGGYGNLLLTLCCRSLPISIRWLYGLVDLTVTTTVMCSSRLIPSTFRSKSLLTHKIQPPGIIYKKADVFHLPAIA